MVKAVGLCCKSLELVQPEVDCLVVEPLGSGWNGVAAAAGTSHRELTAFQEFEVWHSQSPLPDCLSGSWKVAVRIVLLRLVVCANVKLLVGRQNSDSVVSHGRCGYCC